MRTSPRASRHPRQPSLGGGPSLPAMVCIVALVSVSATVVLSLFYELGVTQQRLASLEAFSSSAFASTGRAMEAFDHVDARQRSIADENVVLRAMVADARRWVAGGLLHRGGGQTHREHPFFFRASSVPEASEITAVTQLTADRIDRLLSFSSRWPGPISVALYLCPEEGTGPASAASQQQASLQASLRRVESAFQHPALRARADLHLVRCEEDEQRRGYPTNLLRNVAIQRSRTDALFLTDVDFLPSVPAYPELRHSWASIPAERRDTVALVIAAFETLNSTTLAPRAKRDLLTAVADGSVKPVHMHFKPAHGATNYAAWYTASLPYRAKYEYLYEPYFVVSRRLLPLYDLRFTGYGHDKASHVYELQAAGYGFTVHPTAFITHMHHEATSWAAHDLAVAWRKWWGFAEEVWESYGFSMPLPTWLLEWIATVPCYLPFETPRPLGIFQDIPHDLCYAADAQGELAPFYQQAKEQEGLDADFQPRGSGHQPAPAFDAAATPCGEVGGPIRLNGSSGLVADGYQGQFPAGTRCVWVAPPLRGAQLHLSLHLVDLPPRPSTQGEGESRGTCGPDADSLRIRVLRGDDLAAAAAHSREANNGGDSDLSAPRAAEGQAAPLASPSRIEHRLCHGSRIPPSIALPRGAGVELSLSASLQSPGTAQLVAWVSVQHPLARQEFVERVSETPLRAVVPSRPPKQRKRWLALRRDSARGGATPARRGGFGTAFRSAFDRLVGHRDDAGASSQQETEAHSQQESEPGTYTVKRGDTLGAVARSLGVSAQDLQEYNGIGDPRTLEVGDVLTLPPVTDVGASTDENEPDVVGDGGVEPDEGTAETTILSASSSRAGESRASVPELAVSPSSPGTRSSQVMPTPVDDSPPSFSSSDTDTGSRRRSLRRSKSRRRRGQGGPTLARLRAIIDQDKAREESDQQAPISVRATRRRRGLRT